MEAQHSRSPRGLRTRWLGPALLAAVFWLFGGVPTALAQTIIYVNDAAVQGGDGQTWSRAYDSLPPALAQAAAFANPGNPYEIWVAAGTYRPAPPGGSRSAAFHLINHVAIYGGFIGTETVRSDRDWLANATTLSGDLNGNDDATGYGNFGENSYRVVLAESGQNQSAVLDGFVVTSGYNTLLGGGQENTGAGVRFFQSAPTVRNLKITRCAANFGGGLYVVAATAPLTFENLIVVANTGGSGAGVNTEDNEVTFINCLIANNASSNQFLGPGQPTNTFANGGGMITAGNVAMINCTVTQNSISTSDGWAGGISCCCVTGRTLRLQNSIVTGNTAANGVSLNFMTDAGYALHAGQSCLPIVEAMTVFQMGFVETGTNVNALPGFVDPPGGDFRLGLGSPCIDTGAADSLPPTDILGNRRFHDADGDGSAQPDIGAYEFGSPPYFPRLYVRQSATGANNGASWADAYSGELGLRRALELTAANSESYPEIWVAAGIYRPDVPISQGGDRASSFPLFDGVAIYGGFAGTETSLAQRYFPANPTILSGDLNGNDNGGDLTLSDNSFHVLNASGVGTPGYIDGFIITAGNAAPGGDPDQRGGGMLNLGGRPDVRYCTFSGNRAVFGGAVYCGDGGHASFFACDFRDNISTGQNGGAICTERSSIFCRRCWFEDNEVMLQGAGGGGAIDVLDESGPALQECMFLRNRALSAEGGALSIGPDCSADIRNCQFLGNAAVEGGAIMMRAPNFVFINGCLFTGNEAEGGAVDGYLDAGSNINFRSCTVVGNRNHSPVAGAVNFGCTGCDPATFVGNCILFHNEGPNPSAVLRQLSISAHDPSDVQWCLIEGWTPGGNFPSADNSGAEPQFVRLPAAGAGGWGSVDDDYGDLRPANGSPAIDSGNGNLVIADRYDLDGDGDLTEPMPLDILRGNRFIDAPLIPNTGVGSPPVDRGAIEYSPPLCTPGGTRLWTNSSGGSFASDLDWFPCAPDAQSACLLQTSADYTISFTPSTPVSAQSLTASRGHPTLDLNASTLSLTSGILPSLVVGDAANSVAQLSFTDGTLIPFTTRIGSQLGSDGTLILSGPATRMLAQDDLCVGCFGRGTLRIENGARLFTPTAGIGDQPGSDGSLLEVTGAGSRWDIAFLATINRGRLDVSSGGVVNVGLGLPFTALYLFRDGTITGDGTINGNVVNFGGIEPGNLAGGPGTLTINGGYSQVGTFPELGPVSGRIRAQLAPPLTPGGPARFDQLHVNGPVTLGGGLFVSFLDDFTPSPSDSIPIVSSNQPITTQFDVAFFPALPPPPQGQTAKFLRAVYNPRGGGGVSIIVQDLNGNVGFDPNPQQSFAGFPTAAAIGDLDRNGFPDLAITFADPAGNNDAVVLLRNQGNSAGQWQGFAAQTVQIGNVGDQPSGVVIGDFDGGPGGNDLAVTCRGSNVVTIYQQQQANAGQFTRVQDIAVGAEPSGLCAVDLDRDGRDDLAVTNFADGDLSVLVNGSSPGGVAFAHFPVRFPTRPRPLSPRPTRPDIDKDRDIVVVNGSGNSEEPGGVSVIINTIALPGDDPSFAAPIALPVGRGPVQVASAGLRARDPNDRREDLVALNFTDGTASVIVNTTPDNAPPDQPTYAPAVTYPFATDGQGIAAEPRSIAVIDADRDGPGGQAGDLDIVVLTNSADGMSRVVRVLRNDSVGGQTQVALVELPALNAGADDPVALLVADVDQDNAGVADDLVVVSASGLGAGDQGRVDVLLNALSPSCPADFNGNGALTSQDIFDFLAAFFTPGSVAADFNHSGSVSAQDIFDFLAAFFAGCG